MTNIFKRLHWPPDFQEVDLVRDNGVLDLHLVLRRNPKKKVPAYLWMSAGQRAALAISVFWAFNASPNVPPVLIMDEPIQSIDDLNMLNFLDGLRWLVEGGNRQVFVTTANKRIRDLVRRKFSYLRERYCELEMRRNQEITSFEYRDWEGNVIDGTEQIA